AAHRARAGGRRARLCARSRADRTSGTLGDREEGSSVDASPGALGVRSTELEESMAVQLPTEQQLRQVAAEVGLSLSDDDVQSFIGLMRGPVAAYNVVDAMPDNLPRVKYPRTPGYRPPPQENK